MVRHLSRIAEAPAESPFALSDPAVTCEEVRMTGFLQRNGSTNLCRKLEINWWVIGNHSVFSAFRPGGSCLTHDLPRPGTICEPCAKTRRPL